MIFLFFPLLSKLQLASLDSAAMTNQFQAIANIMLIDAQIVLYLDASWPLGLVGTILGVSLNCFAVCYNQLFSAHFELSCSRSRLGHFSKDSWFHLVAKQHFQVAIWMLLLLIAIGLVIVFRPSNVYDGCLLDRTYEFILILPIPVQYYRVLKLLLSYIHISFS